ncbi:DNA translocase FtsK, partial [uncultured Methylobacterium sp.]|uniref:DNA translocase FtsK n=1 Tax=uncultured Methylobacterium sp. TaxID=157278 RepID=UPI0035CCA7E4
MRASGRPPYSHRDPARPGRGGDRPGLTLGALAHRLMSLRASLTRRLVGGPQRPSYAIAGTRPAPTWLTPPSTLLGRDAGAASSPDRDAGRGRSGHVRSESAFPENAWPDHVFDDRASLDMLEGHRPESRIDASASSPGVLVRSPRRPAAITPEDVDRPRFGPRPIPLPGAVPPAVRYTRTPDTILQERRQRALEAERAAREQARVAALAATLAAETEARARTEADARQAAEAERAIVTPPPGPPMPLWRQPFVAPPGVRFFRTPDRRTSRPSVELSAGTAPAPAEARDLSELPDWADVQPWFEAGDWSSVEAWAALEAEPAADRDAPPPLPAGPDPVPAAPRAGSFPVERYVSVPLDISHLRSLPPAPVYVLDRLVRFDRPLRPTDGQDNASAIPDPVIIPEPAAAPARPALALVFGPGTAPLPSPVEPAGVAHGSAPALSAMAARAAIRAAKPPVPEAPAVEPPVVGMPVSSDEDDALPAVTTLASAFDIAAPQVASAPAPAAVPIAPRPVLLRGRAVPAPEPVPEDAARPDAAEPEPVETVEAPVPAAAAPAMPAVVRPHLIPAGRHLPIASVENADYELPALDLLAMPEPGGSAEVDADVLEQNALNLQQTVQDFGVRGDILAVRPGPVVTLYELEPAPGTKSSRVIGLSDDIARSMSAVSARVAVVPGRNVIGIELPNETRETVFLRELLSAPDFFASKHRLALCLGKNIGGEPIIADLA